MPHSGIDRSPSSSPPPSPLLAIDASVSSSSIWLPRREKKEWNILRLSWFQKYTIVSILQDMLFIIWISGRENLGHTSMPGTFQKINGGRLEVGIAYLLILPRGKYKNNMLNVTVHLCNVNKLNTDAGLVLQHTYEVISKPFGHFVSRKTSLKEQL